MAIRYRISEVFDMAVRDDDGVKSLVLDTRAVRFELVLDDINKARAMAELLGVQLSERPKRRESGRPPRLYAHDVRRSRGVEGGLDALRK